MAVPEWFPTPDNIQYNAAVGELDKIVYRLIAQRRRQLAEGGGGQVADPDLLTRLLEVGPPWPAWGGCREFKI